jgi:hypothetical protein
MCDQNAAKLLLARQKPWLQQGLLSRPPYGSKETGSMASHTSLSQGGSEQPHQQLTQ